MTATESGTAVEAARLLREAHRAVAGEMGENDPLVQAALHLITCAADVVALLPKGELKAAQEALRSARAAVGSATYAVRRIHDTGAVRS